MSYKEKLRGLYVITDDTLTPKNSILEKVELALKGGASLVQLRDKHSDDTQLEELAIEIQKLCMRYEALFILNDNINVAIKIGCDGLHIGKSDHENFSDIRKNFGGIIGVSCYGDVELAKKFELLGADYVAFGSFFQSGTKPDSNIVPLQTLQEAKKKISVPICAIGGISTKNLDSILLHKPDMVSVIGDIWRSEDITSKCQVYKMALNTALKENQPKTIH